MIPSLNTIGSSLQIAEADVFVTATGAAFSKGDVVQLPIDSDGGYTTCITPTAAGIGTVDTAITSDAAFGVVIEGLGIAQNAIGKVRIRGMVDATVLSTGNNAWAVDAQMFPNTSKQLEIDQAGSDANKKIVALATATVTSGMSTPTSRTVFFDGVVGFGRVGGSAS